MHSKHSKNYHFKAFLLRLWYDESGGYGGIFSFIVKTVLTIGGSFLCGPPCAALGSAAGTLITGGSFTEALLAGATTFIGSSIGGAISSGLGAATTIGPSVAGSGFAGGVTDFLVQQGNSLLGDIGLSAGFLAANAGVIGLGVGGAIGLTLNQALAQGLEGLDEELENKFGAEETEFLKQNARDVQLEEVFQGLVGPEGTLANPFLREGATTEKNQEAVDAFGGTVARGLRRQDQSLGLNATQSQFDEIFNNPSLGQNILGEERGIQQQNFTNTLGETFTGDAFGDIDDDIINSIISERQGPAQQQISNFEARGNLNPLGGKTANEFIQGQIPTASDRLREIGSGVQQTNQAGVNDIRDRAQGAIGGFNLGDELFNQEPFNIERSGLIREREGSLRDDLFSSLGSEPLFNVSGALNEAGRAQGVVSGTPNASLLDAIAAREQGGTQQRRGLGSRGSGTF